MSKNITLRPEQIDELAEGIRDSIASLTDIDQIIRETHGDLNLAKSLKARADYAAYVLHIFFLSWTDVPVTQSLCIYTWSFM